MKKTLVNAAKLAALSIGLFLTSCSKDETKTTSDNVAAGIYLVGTATPYGGTADETAAKNKMPSGYIGGDNFTTLLRTGLYTTFVYLKVGDLYFKNSNGSGTVATVGVKDAVNITFDANGEGKDASGVVKVIKSGQNYKNCTQIKGTLDNGGTGKITIPTEGLYVVTYDDQTKQVFVTRVIRMALVGAALEGGWDRDTAMALQGNLSATAGSWKINKLRFAGGSEFKLRINNGWADSLGETSAGKRMEANSSFGASTSGTEASATSTFLLGGPNFLSKSPKPYTESITLNWTGQNNFSWAWGGDKVDDAVTDFDATKNKIGFTGDVTLNDAAAAQGWGGQPDAELAYSASLSSGTTRVYEGTVKINAGSELKIRLNNSWATNWGYGQVTISGAAATDFEGASGASDANFKVKSGVTLPKTYKFKFTITQVYNEVKGTNPRLEITTP